MNKLCVIGSFNIDIVTSVDRFPKIGESIFSNTFDVLVGGGKGANQAVALGKLGADVMMVGKLGDCFYGPEYLDVLKQNGVKCDTVRIEKNTFPGTAIVAVDKNGDNILFVYPGANAMVNTEFIDENWDAIADCDVFLLQLEIPVETNLYVMKRLKELGKTIILDPAPAKDVPDEMFKYTDFVTPNETELEAFSGMTVKEDADFEKAGRVLLEKGVQTVIAKAGKKGAYVITNEGFTHIEGYKVKAVDPTAAGDSFNAGFAYALVQGKELDQCIRFANAVAGLSTTALGAQSAMPTIDEVNKFLEAQNG